MTPFKITHQLINTAIFHTETPSQYVVKMHGTFVVPCPGVFSATAGLRYKDKPATDVDADAGVGPDHTTGSGHGSVGSSHNSSTTVVHTYNPTVTIRDPSGAVFTGTTITASELSKFRNLRGELIGTWSYDVNGNLPITGEGFQIVNDQFGGLNIYVLETVAVASAPPLINNQPFTQPQQTFTFDLHRIGFFEASATNFKGSMQLLDPDGHAIGSSATGSLRVEIKLSHLKASRTMTGMPRLWSLKLEGIPPAHAVVHATVVSEGRVATSLFTSRFTQIVGEHASKLHIRGRDDAFDETTSSDQISVDLVIDDPATAETLDMLDLLQPPKPGVPPFLVNVPISLFTHAKTMEAAHLTFDIDASSFEIKTLDVRFEASSNIAGGVALKIGLTTSGGFAVSFHGVTVGTAVLIGNRLDLEIGVKVDADGMPAFQVWGPDAAFETQMAESETDLLTLVGGGVITIGELSSKICGDPNDTYTTKINALKARFTGPSNPALMDFMMLFGGHFMYQQPVMDGADVLFKHDSPLEPDPRPNPGYVTALGNRGDTWAAPNLTSKINHIVVVMMENRSYDHVLGYRARGAGDGKDGWTFSTNLAVPAARPLSQAGFGVNSLGRHTAIPVPVGHSLADVNEQLGVGLTVTSPQVAGQISNAGQMLNDPAGFISNYATKISSTPVTDETSGVRSTDVVGYYEATDLPMYDYLANNYAYSDKFFSSHPGPTLPNRMFSLTGDVQRDRFGTPILDNNHSDNFLLSRQQTIYDVLQREGVSFRIYESAPSVTMARMFARYAGDDENIRCIERLSADLKAQVVPSVIVVEPAMHHSPQNDDHPTADLWRGQMFIQQVHDAIKASPIWSSTMMIITYDEHGGFYDHVVPPLAETLTVAGPKRAEPGPGHDTSVASVAKVSAGEVAHAHANLPADATKFDGPIGLPVHYGFRVPTFIISPWVPADAHPADLVFDHCSILKTILARFCGGSKPFMSDRVAAANSFEAFVTATTARTAIPDSPAFPKLPDSELPSNPPNLRHPGSASRIITPILTKATMRAQPTDYHDLSGRLARLLGR